MKFILNTECYLKHNLSEEEVMFLLSALRGCDLDRAKQSLIDKGFIFIDDFDKIHITKPGSDVLQAVLLDSDIRVSSPKDLENLVGDMRAMFPKGMQQGKYSWRDSAAVITERLRLFEKYFGKYPYDDIRKATQNYVNRMTGDPFMKTLKYFIISKQKETIESLLANELALLEEGGEEEVASGDWTTNII